jgi:hypothetical protein
MAAELLPAKATGFKRTPLFCRGVLLLNSLYFKL